MSEAPVAPAHDVRPGKSARTRAALRDMALQHFVEHGFERASVPAIAAECGVTERTFARYLDEPDLPDVDLFWRTSGEQRTSNFLPWQSAYAELVFSDIAWPDVDRLALWAAVEEYARRQRRFGSA